MKEHEKLKRQIEVEEGETRDTRQKEMKGMRQSVGLVRGWGARPLANELARP